MQAEGCCGDGRSRRAFALTSRRGKCVGARRFKSEPNSARGIWLSPTRVLFDRLRLPPQRYGEILFDSLTLLPRNLSLLFVLLYRNLASFRSLRNTSAFERMSSRFRCLDTDSSRTPRTRTLSPSLRSFAHQALDTRLKEVCFGSVRTVRIGSAARFAIIALFVPPLRSESRTAGDPSASFPALCRNKFPTKSPGYANSFICTSAGVVNFCRTKYLPLPFQKSLRGRGTSSS